MAADVRIGVLAITDHDTTTGIAEAATAATEHGIVIVSGVEISSQVNGDEIHLLAYGIDPQNAGLDGLLERQRESRVERVKAFFDALRRAGVNLPSSEDIELPRDGSVGRVHVARLIVASGAADSIGEAFESFLTPGAPTFVPKLLPEAETVIQTVHGSGGISVLAHPGNRTSDAALRTLIRGGLDGIEVVHPSHDQVLTTYYRDRAERDGLIQTGGSDFHGWAEEDADNLGPFSIPWPLEANLFAPRTLGDAPAF